MRKCPFPSGSCPRRRHTIKDNENEVVMTLEKLQFLLPRPAFELILAYKGYHPLQPITLIPAAILSEPNENNLFNCYMVPVSYNGSRLSNAVSILERAVTFAQLSNGCLNEKDVHRQEILRRMEDMHTLNMQHESCTFYAAGGFVVSEMLGLGRWRDIDIWWAPCKTKTNKWIIVQGKGGYPVQQVMVINPKMTIECFDLDICQCAIRCQVFRGKRFYEFMVTPNCWRAFCAKKVNATSLHIAVGQQRRLERRLLSYRLRGLAIDETLCTQYGQSCELEPQELKWSTIRSRVLQHYKQSLSSKTYWVIYVHSGCISQVTWKPEWLIAKTDVMKANRASNQLCSEPMLVYPCEYIRSYNNIAYSQGKVHWLIRALAGESYLVSLPGGSVVWSNIIQPAWLVKRRNKGINDILQEMQLKLPCVASKEGTSCYIMQCEWRVQVQSFTCDWLLRPSKYSTSDNYALDWRILVGSGYKSCVNTAMFCNDTLCFCSGCPHSSARRLDFW